MKEETKKSNMHQVRIFYYNRNNSRVKETMDYSEGKPMGHYKVNLINGWCDYGKFLAYNVPCSHVIVACFMVPHNAYALLSNVYKVATLFGVYNTSFPELSNDEY